MKPIAASDLSTGIKAFSDDMTVKVTRKAVKALAPKAKEIARLLREGLFEEAKAEARELKFTDAFKTSEKPIRAYLRTVALLGAGAVDQPSTSLWAQGAAFPAVIDRNAVTLLRNIVVHVLERDTRRALLDRIARAERFQKAVDPIDPDKLASDINRYLRGEIMRVVDAASNIVGTRVSAYGMLHEARVRGVTKYRIDAVLDERTTDICRHMDGRTFSVEVAYTRTSSLLSETDPVAQKKMAPFPGLDEIKDRSNEELEAMGHNVPPFHFLCRSVLTLVSTDVQEEPVAKPSGEGSLLGDLAAAGAGAAGVALGAAAEAAIDKLLEAYVTDNVQEALEAAVDLAALPAPAAKVPRLPPPAGVVGRPEPEEPSDLPRAGRGNYPPINYGLFEEPETTRSDAAQFFADQQDRFLTALRMPRDQQELLDEEFLGDLSSAVEYEPFREGLGPWSAIYEYSYQTDEAINGALRYGNDLSDDARSVLKNLDRIADEYTIPDDMILYRGIDNRALADRMEIGRVFQDDGFGSFSVAYDIAREFAENVAVLKVIVPAGTPVIPAEYLTQYVGEFEIIVPRGFQLRVIGKEIVGETTIIRAVLQGFGDKLSWDRVGLDSLPSAESVVKALEARRLARFIYFGPELREVPMG